MSEILAREESNFENSNFEYSSRCQESVASSVFISRAVNGQIRMNMG
jgi:hypothetical protein